jgi:DNA-binding NtrC family response regulator
VVNITVPPLRERKDDLPLLIREFIVQSAQENGKPVTGIDEKARSVLFNYDWPGNIRELKNCIESTVVMCRGTVITKNDLPPSLCEVESNDENTITISLGTRLEEAEGKIIRETLRFQQGNKSRTAEVLGIGRKTLDRKLAVPPTEHSEA